MVAVAILLFISVGIFTFSFETSLTEPAPNVAESTGEFIPGGEDDEQLVQITHEAGDSVDVEEIEIIVQASGPELDTEARLVNLPGDGSQDRSVADSNIEGNEDLIDQRGDSFGSEADKIIVVEDSNVWEVSDTIQFRIAVEDADFREEERTGPEADELEIVIVHTESDAILFADTFRP